MTQIRGIHHVTCIAGDPQTNLDFYQGVLGMRLVKRSVNQDDPGTYHLFYADAEGHPGSDVTFFPWPHLPAGRIGTGLAVEIMLAVPAGTLPFWAERLAQHGVKAGSNGVPLSERAADLGQGETRFGENILPFTDPHGLPLALVESSDDEGFSPWLESPVDAAQQVRRIHAVRLWVRDLAATTNFLVDAMDFEPTGAEDGWHRYAVAGGGSGKLVDIQEHPEARLGSWGVGSVHHVAWRVADAEAQQVARERVLAANRHPTEVIDRFWFQSVYFKEPGGVLFELATEGPGFAVDEDPAHLGEQLILPPWLEPQRRAIEAVLPALGV